jgi:hypothetical protein
LLREQFYGLGMIFFFNSGFSTEFRQHIDRNKVDTDKQTLLE